MKKIGLRTHGLIDYFIGLSLVTAPAIFNLSSHNAEAWTLMAAGVAILIYSLLSDYQQGVFRIIPIQTHLVLDIIAGMLLCISPWLFDFATNTCGVHLISGLLIIFVALITNPQPVYHLIGHRKRKLHRPLYRTYSMR